MVEDQTEIKESSNSPVQIAVYSKEDGSLAIEIYGSDEDGLLSASSAFLLACFNRGLTDEAFVDEQLDYANSVDQPSQEQLN